MGLGSSVAPSEPLLGKSIGERGRCESTKHFSLLNLIDFGPPPAVECHTFYHGAILISYSLLTWNEN